ncbi:UbiA prenyltransferase family protein [Patescibacteria group bacterium]
MLIQAIKVARPLHWIKNLSIFAALIFSGNLFDPTLQSLAFWAFISFSLATSATYIFNDIRDVKLDQLHPVKKSRPMASGRLPVSVAVIEMVILLFASLYVAKLLLHPLFTVSVLAYLILQFFYSLYFKNIAVLDILIIASGFIIRVYAGAFVTDTHLSVWFLLCVISVALFLASGKRRAELGILDRKKVTRKSLMKYDRELLNSYVTMFGNAAWVSWALFTFFESPRVSTPIWLFFAEISRTTTISKFLMITIPVVIFAIMRYQKLIFEGKSEAPENLLLKDYSLVLSVLLWVLMVVSILYGGNLNVYS